MSTESKIPETDARPRIMRCRKCRVEIATRHTIKSYDADGNDTGVSISVKMCIPCGNDAERRLAASRVDAARRRAKYEKSLADLLNSVPKKTEKQIGFDMGLD